MKKLIALPITALFLSFTLPHTPLATAITDTPTDITQQTITEDSAKNATTPEATTPETPPSTSTDGETATPPIEEKPFRFTLQHRFNQTEPLPKEILEIPWTTLSENPFTLIETIRQSFSKHLEKQARPLQIDSKAEIILPPEVEKILGKLPMLSIKTTIQKDGSGESHIEIPAEKRSIIEDESANADKTLIDWKGLQGHFSFTDKFEAVTTDIQIFGFDLDVEQNMTISLSKTSLQGIFNAHGIPSQMKFNLPQFEMVDKSKDNQGHFHVKEITLDYQTDKTPKGLDIGNFNFRLGQIEITSNKSASPISLTDFTLNTDNRLEGDVVNSVIKTKLGEMLLPKEITDDEAWKMNYASELAFRRLDANALLALQKTARELQSQASQSTPLLMGMTMFGQFMTVIPQLIAKSPEIALTKLTLTTPKGNLQGNANIHLDGKKVTALEGSVLLSALQANIQFTIGKQLLEQVLISSTYSELVNAAKTEGKQPDSAKLAELQQQAKATTMEQLKLLVAGKQLIEDDKANYKVVMLFKNNQFLINGQEMALPFLSGNEPLVPPSNP